MNNNKILKNFYYSDPDRISRGCYYLLGIFESCSSSSITRKEKEAEDYLCGENEFTIKEVLLILKKFRRLYSHSDKVLQKWPKLSKRKKVL